MKNTYWIFVPRDGQLYIGTSVVGDAVNSRRLTGETFPNTRVGFKGAEDLVLARNIDRTSFDEIMVAS